MEELTREELREIIPIYDACLTIIVEYCTVSLGDVMRKSFEKRAYKDQNTDYMNMINKYKKEYPELSEKVLKFVLGIQKYKDNILNQGYRRMSITRDSFTKIFDVKCRTTIDNYNTKNNIIKYGFNYGSIPVQKISEYDAKQVEVEKYDIVRLFFTEYDIHVRCQYNHVEGCLCLTSRPYKSPCKRSNSIMLIPMKIPIFTNRAGIYVVDEQISEFLYVNCEFDNILHLGDDMFVQFRE